MANIIQTFPAGAGSSHTILDSDGTALAQEKNLQFTGLNVTDDSVGELTEVAPAQLNEDSLNDVCSSSIRTNFITSPFNYSTNEQIIGKWIDGKPVYQTTVNFGMGPTAGNNKTVTVNIANVENIIDISGILINSAGSNPLPFIHPGNLGYAVQVDVREKTTSKFNILVNAGSQMDCSTRPIYIYVKYTKTTD